jgi:PKD repeat protein
VLTVLNARDCPSLQSKEITVLPLVQAGFSADITEGCHPVTVNFSNTSSGAISYNWDFDNGQSSGQENPVMTFENFGLNDTVFNVRLIASNIYTCKDSFFVPVLVHPYVEADFAIDYLTQCSPADVNFHNTSVNGQQYSWSFDGVPLETASTDPINRQFPNPSTVNSASYPVDLTVTSPQGCTSGISKNVLVYHRIEADFSSIRVGCQPLEVSFNNASVGARDHRWDFGDNTSSILVNPVHTFTNSSNFDSIFTVKLTVISENFCTDSAYDQITVYPGPKAKFNVDRIVGCSPLEVTVQNLSENGVSYTWNFGDGSLPLTLPDTQPVSHSYINDLGATQILELRLDATTGNGCSDFITQNISVYSSVSVDFERDSAGCSPYYSQFSNTSQRASTYVWDFGDGTASYVSDPGHTFVNPGVNDTVLNVILAGYSEYGCQDSATRQITVYPSPEARFSYTPIYQYYPGSTITLVNETSAGNYHYEWDFDDGITSNQRDPGSYTYTHWGEYNIQMKASSDQCSDSVVHWIKIFPPQPIADFVPNIDTGCVPLTVSFTNNSIYGEAYLWEFDDGGTSTSFEPNHTFNESGFYQVKLTVTGEGGVDYAFHEFEVFVLPVLDFTVEPSLVMLPDQPAKVFNFSKYGSTYLWDFGDGTRYYAKDTSHQYTELGVYDVSLTGWTEHGCEAFMNLPQAVTVIGKGILMFPNAFKPGSSGPTGGWYNPNDPSNEIFFPHHDGVIEYELIIYNRWGELVFETHDVNQGWDGYIGSQRCAEGVYVWRVKVKYANGEQDVLLGDVTLFHKQD